MSARSLPSVKAQPTEEDMRLYTPEEVAEMWGVNPDAIKRMVYRRELDYTPIGRRKVIRFSAEQIVVNRKRMAFAA